MKQEESSDFSIPPPPMVRSLLSFMASDLNGLSGNLLSICRLTEDRLTAME
jgi:hypothetical protein